MWESMLEELVRYVQWVLNKECLGWVVDKDMIQDVIVAVLSRLKCYDERGAMSTYLFYVIRSAVVDYVKRENKLRKRFVSIEEVEVGQLSGDKSFYSDFSRVLERYMGVVGEDFLRIILADAGSKEYRRMLKSAKLSKEKGENLVEKWLGRKLSLLERKCLQELKGLLT